MIKPDGGPAFPKIWESSMIKRDANGNEITLNNTGMSLRDWFAGMVLQSIALGRHSDDSFLAHDCYEIADEMLKAREVE